MALVEQYRRRWRRGPRNYSGIREFEAPAASAIADAESELPRGDPWPDAGAIASGAATVTGAAYADPITTLTASAAVFTAGMVGNYMVIEGVGSFVIATFTDTTHVDVTGDASAASGSTMYVTGLWGCVVQDVDVDIDSESGLAQVVARYWTPRNGAIRRGRGFLLPHYGGDVEEVIEDHDNKLVSQAFWDTDTWYRWRVKEGTNWVERPRKVYWLTVEGSDISDFETLIDALLGTCNATAWEGHAPYTMLFLTPRIRQLGQGEERFECRFRLEKAAPGYTWVASCVAEKQKRLTNKVTDATTGRIIQTTAWVDAGVATETRKFYNSASWTSLSAYVL